MFAIVVFNRRFILLFTVITVIILLSFVQYFKEQFDVHAVAARQNDEQRTRDGGTSHTDELYCHCSNNSYFDVCQ